MVAFHQLIPDSLRCTTITIGHVYFGTQMYIIDEQDQPFELGSEGELHLAGTHLARDYINRFDLTEKAFISDPACPSRSWYRTGDRS